MHSLTIVMDTLLRLFSLGKKRTNPVVSDWSLTEQSDPNEQRFVVFTSIWEYLLIPFHHRPAALSHYIWTYSLSALQLCGKHLWFSFSTVCPLSFHLIPKSPNSTHYSLNWRALTPASGPIELVVISRQDLWQSGAGGSGCKISDTHTYTCSVTKCLKSLQGVAAVKHKWGSQR